ncbi:MAG: lipopolysaccharide biosynthesis protein [Anaerovoracaceae bacterium]
MRIDNSAKNIKIAWLMHIVHVFGQFISRTVIIMVLSVEYVGLSGLFSNVLSMLSLAELGIGEAIVFSLYGPIARGEKKEINAIMTFYQKIYIGVGLFILIAGISLTPAIEYLIKGVPDIPYIHVIYVMYVANSAMSYFFSYRATFIRANQKNYIVTVNEEVFNIISIVIRSVLLIVTGNYLLFMGLGILILLIQNINITLIANKRYPYLKEKSKEKIPEKTFAEIKKNTAAMVFHKIGTIIVFATDNVIISKFLGLASVGLYSNYYTLTSAFTAFINKFFTSISASVGNLAVSESIEKQEKTLFQVLFVNFWLYTFTCSGLFALLNPFIKNIWLGSEYIFGIAVVLLIVIKNYLTGMRKAAQTFKNAKGLYWYNKYMPIYESLINLIMSLILVNLIGISGVLLGTIISSLVTCVWIEPHVLYKYGFGKSAKEYVKKYIEYMVVFLITIAISWASCKGVEFIFGGAGALRSAKAVCVFGIQLLLAVLVSNGFLWIVYRKSDNYKYLYSVIKKKVLKR